MICRQIPPPAKFIFHTACVFAFTTLAGVASAAEVSAAKLDGATISGQLRQWDNNQVLIATPTGDQRIATDQLVSLRWQPASGSPNAAVEKSGLVELIDGSILPITSIRVQQATATLTLALPASSGPASTGDNNLNLPAAQIAVIRFRQLEGSVGKQWDEIRRLNSANDVLAVLKKDGKSLDYVEGVVGEVSADKIEFKLESETQRVDRAKIAGVIYFRRDRRTNEEPRAVIQGRSGLRAGATHIELKDSLLQLTTAGGLKFGWPVDDISLADFSAGKLMYLSDIEPASEKWTPLVGLPPAASLAATYGRPRRDKSAFGGPLALTVHSNAAGWEGEAPAEPRNVQTGGSAGASPSQAWATAAGRSFQKGLTLRSRTEIVYRLPAGFQRFVALAGIDPSASASGNVRLVISGDDRILLETEVAGTQAPQSVQLDIAGVKRLKIVVDFGQNLDSGDWLNLCDARIVK